MVGDWLKTDMREKLEQIVEVASQINSELRGEHKGKGYLHLDLGPKAEYINHNINEGFSAEVYNPADKQRYKITVTRAFKTG